MSRRRLHPSSLRGRVTLTVLALLAVLLAGLFVTVDLILGARLHADLRTRLTDRAALAQQLDGSLGSQQLVDRLRGDGISARLCSATGSCVVADPGPPSPGRGGPRAAPGGSRHGPATPPAVQEAGSTLFVQTPLQDGDVLTLSVDDTQVAAALHRLAVLEVVGGLVALALAALLLGRLVGVALHPLDDMTTVARQIAGGDRGRRLGTGRPDTELGRTAAAFDDMLDALQRALADSQAAEARLRAFLADASHELRTPLTGVQAGAERLLRDDPGRAAAEQTLAGMVRDTRRAASLVDDLLAVARLDEGVRLRLEPTDLVQLADQQAERLRLLAPELTVTVRGAPSATAAADPGRVTQILTNVLDNARHATPPGGAVTLDVREETGQVVVAVTDTGPGVPPEEAERVFDRLVRLDASRSRHTGGAGLGLPIARVLARAHGGDLLCVPTPPGTGARFLLRLPAWPARGGAAGLRGAGGATARGGGVDRQPRPDTYHGPQPAEHADF